MTVYVLVDGHYSPGCGDCGEILGIYRSEWDAKAEMERVKSAAYEGKYPDSIDISGNYLTIEEYEVK